MGDNRGTYVASRTHHAAMWRGIRDEGYRITSTWIDEAGPGETPDLGQLWDRIAREVEASSRLVLYIEPDDFPLKGALVEVGMAIAAKVPIRVVAPLVKLEPRSCRPIGSWVLHPFVRMCASLDEALEGADLCL